MEITAHVLDHVDPGTGGALVEVIVDAAEQKGTGRWTVQSGLKLGVLVSTIAESVFARAASGGSAIREAARGVLDGPTRRLDVTDRAWLVDDVREALWASKVVAYAQGLEQIRAASQAYGWNVDVATVARIWRGGCIIQARLLSQISDEHAGWRLGHPARRAEHRRRAQGAAVGLAPSRRARHQWSQGGAEVQVS